MFGIRIDIKQTARMRAAGYRQRRVIRSGSTYHGLGPALRLERIGGTHWRVLDAVAARRYLSRAEGRSRA